MTSHPVIRFYRGALLIGAAEAVPEMTLVEIAEEAGVEIATNCTSGNCGTCMGTIKSGEVIAVEPLPGGLDEEFVADGAVLCCIQIPKGACDIDVRPPL